MSRTFLMAASAPLALLPGLVDKRMWKAATTGAADLLGQANRFPRDV